MKDYLIAEVDGRKFFKTYILFFIPILIISIITSRPYANGSGYPFLSLAESYLTLLLYFSFFCYLVTTVTFRNVGFPFTATLGQFAPKSALWLFLSTITLGLYGPWFTRNYAVLVLENLSWDGKKASFLSQPKKLLVSMLLYLYLPLLILSVFFVVLYTGRNGMIAGDDWGIAPLAGILILLVSMAFFHVYLRWLINLEFSGYRIVFNATPGETFRVLAGQIFLSIITAFIYGPAAWTRMYSFVTSKISFDDEQGQSRGTLGFDGSIGEGFLLIWGQSLLCLITLGFYGPWAMARVSNWVLNRTYLEGDLNL